MTVTWSVLAIGVAVAVGRVLIGSQRQAAQPGGVDPAASEDGVIAAIEERPALVRAIRRMPVRSAGRIMVIGGFVVVLGLAVAAGAMLDMVRTESGFARLDASVAAWGAENATVWSTRALTVITQLGSSPLTIVLASIVAWVAWRRRSEQDAALFLAVVFLGHSAISNGIKFLVDRPRPEVEHLVMTGSSSFPSTHSGTAAAMWAAMALVLGVGASKTTRVALAATAASVAALVAASRALLGVHWLTDVLAGLAIGLGWFVLVAITFGGGVLRLGEPAARVRADTDGDIDGPITERGGTR